MCRHGDVACNVCTGIVLLETIESATKKDVIYGMKGEKVSLISVRGEVLLVSDSKGKTFPVHRRRTNYEV